MSAVQNPNKDEDAVLGRPAEMQGGKRVNVYLDSKSIALALRLGDGNLSAGIRKALEHWGRLPPI